MIKKRKHNWIKQSVGIYKCSYCGMWLQKRLNHHDRFLRDNIEDKSPTRKNCFKLSNN